MNTLSYWLWVGTFGMAIGSIIITLIGSTMRKEDSHHVYLALAITLTAATAYYAMVNNIGDIVVNGHTIQVARYADWVITTPLLLISLISVALPSRKSKDKLSLIAVVVGLDVYMIVTGLIATLADNSTKYAWYIFSTIALIGIVYVLYSVVLTESRRLASKGVSNLYLNLSLYLSLLWIAYPVVWYLSPVGQGSIDFVGENMTYAILDLLAKVGFGIFLLVGIKRLAAKNKPSNGEATVEA